MPARDSCLRTWAEQRAQTRAQTRARAAEGVRTAESIRGGGHFVSPPVFGSVHRPQLPQSLWQRHLRPIKKKKEGEKFQNNPSCLAVLGDGNRRARSAFITFSLRRAACRVEEKRKREKESEGERRMKTKKKDGKKGNVSAWLHLMPGPVNMLPATRRRPALSVYQGGEIATERELERQRAMGKEMRNQKGERGSMETKERRRREKTSETRVKRRKRGDRRWQV